jgi:hypothetical protein
VSYSYTYSITYQLHEGSCFFCPFFFFELGLGLGLELISEWQKRSLDYNPLFNERIATTIVQTINCFSEYYQNE